jgi:hypothetical protein
VCYWSYRGLCDYAVDILDAFEFTYILKSRDRLTLVLPFPTPPLVYRVVARAQASIGRYITGTPFVACFTRSLFMSRVDGAGANVQCAVAVNYPPRRATAAPRPGRVHVDHGDAAGRPRAHGSGRYGRV